LFPRKAPASGSIKVNFDGGSRGNPRDFSFGGIIGDELGQWIMGFSGSCGNITNINVELHAIFLGLQAT